MDISGRVAGELESLLTIRYANVNSVSIVNNIGDMLLMLNGLGKISSNSSQHVR